jgi:hypothetical protein
MPLFQLGSVGSAFAVPKSTKYVMDAEAVVRPVTSKAAREDFIRDFIGGSSEGDSWLTD